MADVFSPTWVNTPLNIKPAGISQFLIKIGADAAYYDLGTPRNPKLDGKALTKDDALLRNLGWGFHHDLSVESLQASAVELKILDNLVLKSLVGFSMVLADGLIIKDATPLFGIRWIVHSKGDFDDFRYIEYHLEGNIKQSEQAGLFSTTPVTVGTPDAADALFTLAQVQVPTNRVPNGVTKIEFKASGDSVYAVLGEFQKAVWTLECLHTPGAGARQRPRTYGMKFMLDIHGLQSTSLEIGLIDDLQTNDIDLKITHADGMVLTFPHTNFAMVGSFLADGNVDKERGIDYKVQGSLLPKYDGSVFQSVGGTAYDSMFS